MEWKDTHLRCDYGEGGMVSLFAMDSFPRRVIDNNTSILADYHTLKGDVEKLKRQVSIFAVSFSPDSKYVATGSDSQISVHLISLIQASQNLCS